MFYWRAHQNKNSKKRQINYVNEQFFRSIPNHQLLGDLSNSLQSSRESSHFMQAIFPLLSRGIARGDYYLYVSSLEIGVIPLNSAPSLNAEKVFIGSLRISPLCSQDKKAE